MKSKSISLIAFLVVNILLSAGFLLGVRSVPFHPDESTFLYLSGDFELLWQRPGAMFWQPEKLEDARQRYRTLDAPLGRYLVGFGRWAGGQPALPVDWAWGKNWEENLQAGAMPTSEQLLAGRIAAAALFPPGLLLLFLLGRKIGGEVVGWTAALLLVSNALILLHGRRSMSEGAVVFTSILTLWTFIKAGKRPWLAAIPAALALCAKHSLAALAPVGLLTVLWRPQSKLPLTARLKQAESTWLCMGALSSCLIHLYGSTPFWR